MKYIDADAFKVHIEAKMKILWDKLPDADKEHPTDIELRDLGMYMALEGIVDDLVFFQQEKPKENNLPSKRTRVNYAICKLRSFKPLREAIVLDDYVYDEGKCYRENLLNYIHAIPENRLTEIRSYLKENGWWPYDDDADWMKQEQPEVDLEKEIDDELDRNWRGYYIERRRFVESVKYFYNLGLNARKEESK